MARLGVRLDHVATLRQARRAQEPDPVHAAVLAELAGASAILVHLRGDRRHVQDRDVELLRQVVKTRLHLEMAATQDMLRAALTVRPDQVSLVPERPQELTTEGGLDVVLNAVGLKPTVKSLQDAQIRVFLFVDADLEQVKQSHKLAADGIELNSADWALARDATSREAAFRKLQDAARLGRKLGLEVQAGRGLSYGSAGQLAGLAEIEQLNLGHSILARAVLVGIERAVREMRDAIQAEASTSG